MRHEILGLHDLIVVPLFLIILYIWAYSVKNKNIKINPEYSYFIPALSLKFGVGIFFCLIYTYYYEGGDTTNYFLSAKSMVNLAFKNFDGYLMVLFEQGDPFQRWIQFDNETGFPSHYMFRDPKTFSVVRYSSVLLLFCFQSYAGLTLFLGMISFFGVFRFYKLLVELYPTLKKEFAIGILFIPSAVFWGSGLLKDTYTFSALCWFVTSFHYIFLKREKIILNTFYILISIFIIVTIKAYILNAVLPGALLWATFSKIKSFNNQILKYFLAPIFIIGVALAGFYVLLNFSDSFGDFSLENSLDEALVTQNDLKREVYGENSFDIGPIDPSFFGMLSKAPLAIEAGLFRPYLWEAGNAMMILSAVENMFLLILTITVFFKVGFFKILSIIKNEPFVPFALLFSLFFAFSIGFSTPNFGALIRYKIPLIPFFVPLLYILRSHIKIDKYRKDKKAKKKI